MSQYSTGRTQLATDRTTEPHPAPKSAASVTVPHSTSAQEGVTALHGVMTGLANLVNEQLERLTIGPQATRFLRHLERQTFGNAGLHRRAGRSDPGLWCPYHHREWAEALDLSASALTHLRNRLVEAGVLWYTPDPDQRGSGAVGWSFDFAAWKPPQWGGARRGAGRPSTALPATVDAHVTARPIAVPTIQDVNDMSAANPADEIKMSTNQIQDVNETESRRQRVKIKMSTKRSGDAAPAQHAAVPAHGRIPPQEGKEEQKKKRRNADADASGVTSTPHRAPAAPIIFAHHPPRQTKAADEHLPPPLPYETLRSYWLRLYREATAACGKEAQAIAHAAARTLVGMGSARADYVLLGQLRQTAGSWATVLHWLLECGTRELADPCSYLRAIAARQLSAGPPPPSPRAGTRGPSLDDAVDRAGASGGVSVPDLPGDEAFEEDDEHAAPSAPPEHPTSDVSEQIADDRVDSSTCVSAASLWQMTRQRLRADVSAAQYTSWLVGTELVRAPDGTYLLLTRTTFAGEHISRLWGHRIAWILREITGRPCVLTTQRRRPDVDPHG